MEEQILVKCETEEEIEAFRKWCKFQEVGTDAVRNKPTLYSFFHGEIMVHEMDEEEKFTIFGYMIVRPQVIN